MTDLPTKNRHFAYLRESLRLSLMMWLVLPMACVLALSLWLSHRTASQQAGIVTDQLLIASARVIAEQVHFTNGHIEANIPPAALEIFASQSRDRAVYRITDRELRLIAGYEDLNVPLTTTPDFTNGYFYTNFRAETMRGVVLQQPVVTPSGTTTVVVVVAETLKGQRIFIGKIWFWEFLQQAFLLIVAASFIWIGISRGLAPLTKLRQTVVDRKPDNFEPLSETGLQTEIQPLVSALNDFMARLDRQIARQRTFLENAAHQLRTPLAILKTQIGYGLKTGNLNDKNTALAAADGSINAMTRLTNQLLILARAEHDKQSVNLEPVDLSVVALDVISKAAPRALAAGIELVLDAEGQHKVMAQAMLVHEMFSNLVDNAILYAGQGAEVTVVVTSLGDEAVVKVQDNGPGIAEQDRAHAFERFQRGDGATGSGSGLGLSIVTEIAQLFGGNASIDESHEKGLAIIISMPSLR